MRTLLALAASSLLIACSGPPAPPSVAPSDFSTRPALVEKGYAQTVVVQDFPMEISDLRAWLMDGNKVVAAMDGGGRIAGPKEAVYFDGEWPNPGATRRIELTDGHYVLEKVLVNTAEAFEYQIWGMTSAVGNNVEHVHGIQAFETLPNGRTRMTWTYKVKPNAGFKRPFVQRFVNNNIEPMLSGALNSLRIQADKYVAEQVSG